MVFGPQMAPFAAFADEAVTGFVAAHRRWVRPVPGGVARSTETPQGLARLAREIERQAAMIGYLNAFGLYMAASAIAILFVLLAKGKPRAASGQA